MSANAWYKDWFNSKYYHQLYFQRDEQEAAVFIDRLIAVLQPSTGCRMLDVACGKGRHAIQLAAKGFEVTGIDLSEESIREANQFAGPSLQFFQHDMRLPFYCGYFDYAFNFFTSFGYFRTRREHDNALRSISQSLRPGGKLVLDFLNVSYAESVTVPLTEQEIDGISYRIKKWHDATHFYKSIEVLDPQQPQIPIYTEQVAKFRLDDFEAMFSGHQLHIKQVYGDYLLNHYQEQESSRLILVAQKV